MLPAMRLVLKCAVVIAFAATETMADDADVRDARALVATLD